MEINAKKILYFKWDEDPDQNWYFFLFWRCKLKQIQCWITQSWKSYSIKHLFGLSDKTNEKSCWFVIDMLWLSSPDIKRFLNGALCPGGWIKELRFSWDFKKKVERFEELRHSWEGSSLNPYLTNVDATATYISDKVQSMHFPVFHPGWTESSYMKVGPYPWEFRACNTQLLSHNLWVTSANALGQNKLASSKLR